MINTLRTNIILREQGCSMASLISDILENPMGKSEKSEMNIDANATNAHLNLFKFICNFNGMMNNLISSIIMCDQKCSIA